MKLILLLVAIYSLIFYQHYKIEKSNVSIPGPKRVFKPERSYQQSVLREQEGYGNAELLIRSNYPGYRYSNTREFQMTGPFFYEYLNN